MVEECLLRHGEFDKHNLFRIAMNSSKTTQEKLHAGLKRRRRVISGF